ncbi:MAG TPA: hypothetical protein ENK50_00570, partial [Sedimenticola sp.]|nr:hypothetical protein [Sedimenticola sp.]
AGEAVGSRNRSLWWGYFPVYLVAFVGLVITFYAFREVTSWERLRVETVFQDASGNRILVVKRELDYTLGTVQDIASFFDASKATSRREFRMFVEPVIQRRGRIKALGWVPQVEAAEKNAFLARARRSFPPFRIKQTDLRGEPVNVQRRSVYYPVLYVQPYKKNKQLLGMDMAADPVLHALLRRAADTGEMQVSKGITLLNEGIERTGFMVAVPVYRKGPESSGEPQGEPAPGRLRGFAFGIFLVGDIVELALESLSAGGIDIRFYGAARGEEHALLYTHVSRMSSRIPLEERQRTPDRGLEYRQSLLLGQQRWEAVCTPIRGRFEPDPWSGWIVLAGGIPFSILLSVYVATLVGRARKIDRLVGERTRQLQGAVHALNREISERRHAEEKLKELNDDLEYWVAIRTSEAQRRAQDLEQFAYVASHDLKAPLRAISNLADWIGEDLGGKLTPESTEQLALLKDRVKRMNALIEGLLEYSRVGRTEGALSLLDTRELIEEIVDSLAPGPGFKIEVGEGMPVFRTDRLLLGQVFSNLIGNALKHHGGEEGHIRISVTEQPGFFEFLVEDDGIGIAPEYHDKVFMIFQTLEARDYGGNTGIGLALVRKIVREQGGVITLASKPGEGARFRFTWPKAPSSVAA